jgi:hypothetical protein
MMQKLNFPLISTQDYNTESKRSSPSLPHLIIGTRSGHGTLTLI